ncbi:MAG TPA: CpsD/CapB family tyrosine-protein kinase [Candidatus Acidoferrum sp.]|nr:CpsD/CapB family tyrosine-protein kinase [Candidatus Acidoferrum sp.]
MSRIFEALLKVREQQATAPSGAEAELSKPAVVEADNVREEVRRGPRFEPSLTSELGEPPVTSAPGLDVLRTRCAQPGWRLHKNYAVSFNKESFDRCAEQFRSLRARLYRLRDKKYFRTLLITSSVAGEGKTFVSLNLARAIARQHERHALLIDADLRAPKLHVSLGAPSSPGLSEYLRGQTDEFSIIQMSATENLSFIPAGGPVSNPAELLASARTKSLLERLSPVFDWVIVDAPPVLLLSDAGLLAGMCDRTILVVGAGSTSCELAQTACQELRESNLLGIVLNGAEESPMGNTYGYYAGSRRGED